jgi:chromosome segregation ATPase
MPPTTRSSIRFELASDGGWQILECSSARKMTSEELNEFARQLNEANRELEEAEVKLAKITAEKEGAEKKPKRMDEAMRRSEEMREKESVLEEVASHRGHEEPAEREVDKARKPGTAALGHDQLVHISAALSQLTT